jgi:hypothetical protein
MTEQKDQQKTHGITKNKYTNEDNKATEQDKVCDLRAGMTTGSRKQTNGFADLAQRNDEVLERSRETRRNGHTTVSG